MFLIDPRQLESSNVCTLGSNSTASQKVSNRVHHELRDWKGTQRGRLCRKGNVEECTDLPILFHIDVIALLLWLHIRHLLEVHLIMSTISGFILTLRLCLEGDSVVGSFRFFTVA